MPKSLINLKQIPKKAYLIPVLYGLFLGITGLVAQSLIRVQAEVDKSVITIGDRITYTLTIQHEKGLHIQQPGPGANLGQFEIKDYHIENPVEKDNLVTQKFNYQISVFDTGKFVIPPFPVAFSESDTSRKYQLIQSEPIEIFVKSVLTSENAEIKDIKPPLSIPFNYRKWILFGSAGLLLIAGGILLFYIIRQHKRGIPLFRKEVIRPAHEIALEALAELKSRWQQMLENGEHKQLFTILSEIMRQYLENRFFIKALEETTYEIEESLQELELSQDTAQHAQEILELSDLVKFAKYGPQAEETQSILEKIEMFVEETKIVFEAVENKIPVENAAEIEPAGETELITEE
jgi:hypothetical protein